MKVSASNITPKEAAAVIKKLVRPNGALKDDNKQSIMELKLSDTRDLLTDYQQMVASMEIKLEAVTVPWMEEEGEMELAEEEFPTQLVKQLNTINAQLRAVNARLDKLRKRVVI